MKSKLFVCFRPVGIETEAESNGPDCFDDRIFARIPVPIHKNPKISVVKSPVSAVKTQKFPEKNEICSRNMDKRKSFSGIVKALLFEISLKKKARNRKAFQLTVDPKSSNSSKSSDGFSDISKSSDTNSLASSSSSNSYSSSSNSTPTQKNPHKNSSSFQTEYYDLSNRKQQSITEIPQQVDNRVTGLFLILISLAVTLFYGRFCGVLFTSLFLYLLSRRRIYRQPSPETTARASPEMGSAARDYRKRVIMEGLLERNHQRRGH